MAMTLRSSPQRYGTVPIVIHWLSALAIFVMLGTGLTAANTADAPAKTGILTVHVSVGICVLLLTLLRVVWWLAVDRRPEHHAGIARWQARLSHLVHYALYAVILLMLASGVALALLSGLLPALFTGGLAALPEFTDYPPFFAHWIGGWALIGLVALHVAAALRHHFLLRDSVLTRMITPSSGRE
jgi:cytochrome b561